MEKSLCLEKTHDAALQTISAVTEASYRHENVCMVYTVHKISQHADTWKQLVSRPDSYSIWDSFSPEQSCEQSRYETHGQEAPCNFVAQGRFVLSGFLPQDFREFVVTGKQA